MSTQHNAVQQLQLDPHEMAFRSFERDIVIAKRVTTVFRPGARKCGAFRSYCPGMPVTLRVINEVGLDRSLTAPEFDPDIAVKVQITSSEVFEIASLTETHFAGAHPLLKDVDTLCLYLGCIYNLHPSALAPTSLITRTTFTYL